MASAVVRPGRPSISEMSIREVVFFESTKHTQGWTTGMSVETLRERVCINAPSHNHSLGVQLDWI